MKDIVKSTKILGSTAWEFFFQLIFLSPVPSIIFWLFYTLEKILLLIPCILPVFYGGDWNSISTFFNFFNVTFFHRSFSIISY